MQEKEMPFEFVSNCLSTKITWKFQLKNQLLIYPEITWKYPNIKKFKTHLNCESLGELENPETEFSFK